MLDLNVKAMDSDAAVHGKWIEYDDGISFKIAINSNPANLAAMRVVMQDHGERMLDGDVGEEEADSYLVPIQADTILLDWKGLTNGGKEFPCNRDNKIALLADGDYTELRQWIVEQSKNMENFRREQVKKPQAD